MKPGVRVKPGDRVYMTQPREIALASFNGEGTIARIDNPSCILVNLANGLKCWTTHTELRVHVRDSTLLRPVHAPRT